MVASLLPCTLVCVRSKDGLHSCGRGATMHASYGGVSPRSLAVGPLYVRAVVLYGRRRTLEGSFVPHTRAIAQYVNVGPTLMFSVARAHTCLFPPSFPYCNLQYILTALRPGLSIIPETSSPRNFPSKRRSFLYMEPALARTVCRETSGARCVGSLDRSLPPRSE